MEKNNLYFGSRNGVNVYFNKWFEEDTRPRAVVQIAHGMAEHIDRYSDFAKELTAKGFIVYGNDHRGHGKTAGAPENLGYFADEDGWNLVVEDMHELTNIIRKENPDLPIFLFGHSMGSFLSRSYIQIYGKDIAGVILSGTGGNTGLLGYMGTILAKGEMRIRGKKARSKRMDRLSFGGFNNSFKPNRTNFDWISRDNNEVDKYVEDPYCGEIFTAGFFYDFLRGINDLMQKHNIDKIPKELPIYLIAGEKDPVGKNGKAIIETYNSYKKAGIKDLSYKIYEEARHEILNEINKAEVYEDIINWLNHKVSS